MFLARRTSGNDKVVVAILGSGFGLYGYLPALVGGCGQRIVLPENYRVQLSGRPELAPFAGSVHWAPDESAALDCADQVVVALRPIDQIKRIPLLLKRANIKGVLLEKPLADSPGMAATILRDLIDSRKVVRMGYIFRYTSWGERLRNTLRERGKNGLLFIQWEFLAHHFRCDLRNWKRFSASGGGAIRFYGIQLIAFLAEIGYHDVVWSRSVGRSTNEIEKWSACLEGTGLPNCSVTVDAKSKDEGFRVEWRAGSSPEHDVVLADMLHPFASSDAVSQREGLDPRVPALIRLCRSLWEATLDEYGCYEAMVNLWRAIEANTQFQMSDP
jgi:hypothetical protein